MSRRHTGRCSRTIHPLIYPPQTQTLSPPHNSYRDGEISLLSGVDVDRVYSQTNSTVTKHFVGLARSLSSGVIIAIFTLSGRKILLNQNHISTCVTILRRGSGQLQLGRKLQTSGQMTHSCLKFWPRSHTVVHNYTLTTTQYVQTAVDSGYVT